MSAFSKSFPLAFFKNICVPFSFEITWIDTKIYFLSFMSLSLRNERERHGLRRIKKKVEKHSLFEDKICYPWFQWVSFILGKFYLGLLFHLSCFKKLIGLWNFILFEVGFFFNWLNGDRLSKMDFLRSFRCFLNVLFFEKWIFYI